MKGSISISRPSYADGKQVILIQVKDKSSRVRFLDIEIDLDLFAKVITGLSEQDCNLTVRKLGAVGKEKETMPFSFKMPEHDYHNRNKVANDYAKKALTDGWIFNGYLGSKGSFTGQGDDIRCNSTIYRYV
jgi:hypothetical protein